MFRKPIFSLGALLFAATAAWCASGSDAPAMGWHVTMRGGFYLTCARMDANGDKVRLFLDGGGQNYTDVSPQDIVASEQVELPALPETTPSDSAAISIAAKDAKPDVRSITAGAANRANLDADLIASIIHAESAGNAHAVSRAGARGLMQLMPGTAGLLGVSDVFSPAQNVNGGTEYFNQLLVYYEHNVARFRANLHKYRNFSDANCAAVLALAAYNAGPGAVDKYRGVPPFRETQAYVARVIDEFNRRVRNRATAGTMLASNSAH